MDLKEQNWKSFTTHHLQEWHGIWTRYSLQKAVKESFQSLRSFKSNPEQTEISQTNRYLYADGKIVEESWQYDRASNSLSDGLFHPSRQSRRGLFLPSGHAAWITTQLETDSRFAVELFFKYEQLRHSINGTSSASNCGRVMLDGIENWSHVSVSTARSDVEISPSALAIQTKTRRLAKAA